MNILLIDDYPPFLLCITSFLRQQGHAVNSFTDPVAALANVSEDVELVISDVMMPAMDGFRVAREVENLLGATRPRTLLTSSNDRGEEMLSIPPARVIGFVTKPALVPALRRLLPVLAETRHCCPGQLPALTDAATTTAIGTQSCPQTNANLCHSDHYASCPRYNNQCGLRFRKWVETR